jgi:hypothetical protein
MPNKSAIILSFGDLKVDVILEGQTVSSFDEDKEIAHEVGYYEGLVDMSKKFTFG